MEAIRMQNVSFTYPGQAEPALKEVSLTVRRGEILVLCGPSGCGKSTLLRQLKTALRPRGSRSGTVFVEGEPLDALDQRTQAEKIGFVFQSPENQIVTDKVWHELAFGLESLGYDTAVIRRRVAEMATFFGIQNWFYRDVAELSGGQKQLLNLASVMVLQPDILVLDEPTAQLDPIAASDFLAALEKINRELGTTILLTEHRLDEALAMAGRMAVLEGGILLCAGEPKEIGQRLKAENHPLFFSMPAAMRIWAAVENDLPCPVTVREGRDWLAAVTAGRALLPLPEEKPRDYPAEPAVEAEELWFGYRQDGPDVVRGMSLTLHRGEFLALLGGNGTGKTTTLKLLSGLLRHRRGKVTVRGKVGVLPQDPQTLLVKSTLREDLEEVQDLPKEQASARAAEAARLCGLEALLTRHPYDLSGGEQQRAALAKILLTQPDILLLDEPTKGMDAAFKTAFTAILRTLLERGTAVLMVSHDVEFCARYAHRCALFFDGAIAAQGSPREFFAGNRFYTTTANRMARQIIPEAVTPEEVIAVCGGTIPPEPPQRREEPPPAGKPPAADILPRTKKRTSARGLLSACLTLLLIPLTLYAGVRFPGGRNYGLTALLVLLEGMLPVFLLFEGRRPRAREVAVIAALCALGVAGRAAFFMLPEFKPVMALTIIAGVALGSETGFLVGAVTMLVSNMLFSQGPWTPWQMFAMGIIGFLAGTFFSRSPWGRSRGVLAVFGALCAVLIYGGIMNPASYLMWAEEFNGKILLTYYATGLPVDCVHAAATAFFLWFGAQPLLEKLDRIKLKYNLME